MNRPLHWLMALGLACTLVLASPASSAQQPPGIEIPSWTNKGIEDALNEEPEQAAQAGPGLPAAPTQVPINGPLVLLALAGAAYAIRRLRRPEA